MKRTPEDEAFAIAFGQELKRHYDRETDANGISDEAFAATLDVSRAALHKYLLGQAMPSVRVLALAFARYGIALEYFGMRLFAKRAKAQKAQLNTDVPAQLVLPFSVRGLNAASIKAQIAPRGENSFELRIDIRRAS